MQILGLLSDFLLLGATGGIALWCRVLARRLRAFDDLDTGIGSKVAALERQARDLDASVGEAVLRNSQNAAQCAARIDAALGNADDRIGRMEMLLVTFETLEEEAADRLLVEVQSADTPSAPLTMAEAAPPTFRASRARSDFQPGGPQ